MTTVLQYLVIAGVIGLVVFGIAVFVFGRGEQLAPLSPRMSPTELPDRAMSGDDVRKVRFAMAVRGYRMSDVDWALERMAEELDRLNTQVAVLTGTGGGSTTGPTESFDDPESDRGPAVSTGVVAGPVLSGISPSPTDGSGRAAVSPISGAPS